MQRPGTGVALPMPMAPDGAMGLPRVFYRIAGGIVRSDNPCVRLHPSHTALWASASRTSARLGSAGSWDNPKNGQRDLDCGSRRATPSARCTSGRVMARRRNWPSSGFNAILISLDNVRANSRSSSTQRVSSRPLSMAASLMLAAERGTPAGPTVQVVRRCRPLAGIYRKDSRQSRGGPPGARRRDERCGVQPGRPLRWPAGATTGPP